ncbi:MAG: hypothetical protein PHO54_02215, partial [Candidatus Peribacteraceae bacterium]|nr:hypothetical protein [Candidatus Peribacteraceae bacterium]
MEPIRTFHGFSRNSGERRLTHLNVQPGMGGEPNVPANELGQVPPELRKYFNQRDPYHQPMDPTKPGRMLFNRESYERDQALDRYEQRSEQFNERVMNARNGLAGLDAKIMARAEQVSTTNRQAYMDLRSGLYQRFNGVLQVLQQDLNMERQDDVYMSRSQRPQWEMQNGRAVKRFNRFVYVAELDRVLQEFARKVANQDKLIRSVAEDKKKATGVAEEEYKMYRDKVFENAEVIDAKKRVEEGEAAVLRAKRAGALKELPQIKLDNDDAQMKAEKAAKDLSKAEGAATAAKEAVKTAKENMSKSAKMKTDIAALEGKVDALNKEIADLRAGLPKVTADVAAAKAKIIRDYNGKKTA